MSRTYQLRDFVALGPRWGLAFRISRPHSHGSNLCQAANLGLTTQPCRPRQPSKAHWYLSCAAKVPHMAHALIYPHPLTGRTIRLLNIEPGYTGSPLCCTLRERSLDDASAPYYALSYCWGTGSSPIEITCNSQPLLVTPNLHAVLLEYRRRGVNTPLWVDAVCINQFNVTERTSQVRMMKTIYSQAARVVVWLGEAAATDGMAIEVLKDMYAPWATFRDPTSGRELPLFTGQNDANHDASLAARVPYAYFDALAAFLLRPWFSRIWMLASLPEGQR